MAVGSSRRRKPTRPSSDRSPPPMAFSSSSISQSRIKTSKNRNHLRKRLSFLFALVAFSLFLFVLYINPKKKIPSPIESDSRFYTFEIANEFPHDPNAFTQGLLYGGNDTLFESTGLYGRSSVRQVLLQTGKVLVNHQMGSSLFGEGLTLLGERKLAPAWIIDCNNWLFQVTWLKNTGFIYDRYDFSKRKKFTHQMQDGWGLATDGKVIFGSDGSSTLYQLDPLTWKAIHKVTVRYNDHEIPFLNELEYINGEVWANVWQSDCIARISHHDGIVHSWILLHELRHGLLKSGHSAIDVLNGIAWDEENNRLFVTGKLWPKLYEIKLRPITQPLNEKIEDICSIRA